MAGNADTAAAPAGAEDWPLVVKVIAPPSGAATMEALVYDEKRDVMALVWLPPGTIDLEGEPKRFFRGRITGSHIAIGERIRDQPW